MRASILFRLSVALVAGVACFAVQATQAHAEEPFPAAIQDAAGLPCAPQCTLCHTTNPGQAGTWVGKPFGQFMGTNGLTKGAGAAGVAVAFEKYKADPTHAAGLARLAAGQDPDNGLDLCQITYGCGARIAKDEPRDDWSGLMFVAGAMGLGAILRRAKQRRSAE